MDLFWHILFWLSLGLLVYTQLGYLAISAIIAAFSRRRVTPSMSEWPNVTLVIPAYNEESVLQAKLENALVMDYPDDCLEIIVASDGSSDGTVEIARSFADRGVRLLDFNDRRGKASLLNDAAAAAEGDLLCLCDANVMFQADALKRMVSRLQDATVGAVSGDVRLKSRDSNFGEGEAFYYRIERALQTSESRIGSMMGVDGGMYVIRRELFEPLPPDTILDDFTTTMNVIRQRRSVAYEPDAVAHENGTPTARMEFKRRARVTSGAMQILKRRQWPPLARPVELWQFVSHKLLRWIEPVLLIAILVSCAVLWNSGIFYRIALIGQIIFYLLGLAGTLAVTFRETRLGGIVFYFVMSHVAMTVGIVKGIFNRQPVTWTRTERTPTTEKPESTSPAVSQHR
ncbi:glycosyltransferase family 2 protein [Symmachiella dynata]|uniref:glycosyltransferase family 2 protein n=1 Tax=Symmachiella dynata TaxID=2527995 RepID=UPI0030EF81DA